MSTQLSPFESQSRQRYVNEVGLPAQVPLEAVTVWPCCGVPEIDGNAMLTGGATRIVPVGADVAAVDPPALAAVTMTRRVLPTSDPCST